MTEPLPKKVLAELKAIVLLHEGHADKVNLSCVQLAAKEMATFDRDFWRDYWCALVCVNCGNDPTRGLMAGQACWCDRPVETITRAAFTVAQKAREGR